MTRRKNTLRGGNELLDEIYINFELGIYIKEKYLSNEKLTDTLVEKGNKFIQDFFSKDREYHFFYDWNDFIVEKTTANCNISNDEDYLAFYIELNLTGSLSNNKDIKKSFILDMAKQIVEKFVKKYPKLSETLSSDYFVEELK